MIEQYELDQIIGIRNQFGPNRYQVISESLFFESHDLIDQAATIIRQQKDREQQSKLDKNDHFIIFAMNILQQKAFTQYKIFNSQFIKKFRETNSENTLITSLNKIIRENIDMTNTKKNDVNQNQGNPQSEKHQEQQKKEVKIQDVIIIELENSEISDLIRRKVNQLDEGFYIALLEKKSTNNFEFWENQDALRQVYQNEISKLIQNMSQNQTLIYLTRKEFQLNDVKTHFEQNYTIKINSNETEELSQDFNNNVTENFIPLITFNQLFKEQVIYPILELSKLNRQVNFQEISNRIGCIQNQTIEVFLKLIETFENCKQIIRWVNLIEKYLQEKSVSTSYVLQNQEQQQIKKIQDYLNQCYQQYDKRFQDKFYNIMQENSYDEFQNSRQQIENNQDSKDALSGTYFSIVLYEIKENALLLYQGFKIGSEIFNVLAKLDFPEKNEQSNQKQKNQTISESTEIQYVDIGQISLVEKEEGRTVYTLKFQLKEENYQLILNKNQKYRDLIMEALMKSVAIKVKQTMFNPTSRKFATNLNQFYYMQFQLNFYFSIYNPQIILNNYFTFLYFLSLLNIIILSHFFNGYKEYKYRGTTKYEYIYITYLQKKVCITPVGILLRLPQKIDISMINYRLKLRLIMKSLKSISKQKLYKIYQYGYFARIKCGIIMNLNFGLDLESSFIQEDKIVYFKDLDLGKGNFWQSAFYTRYHEDQLFQTQQTQSINKQDILQQKQIYNKYQNFILIKEQLKMNLYPIDEKIYSDYMKLDGEVQKIGIINFAIDCEMVLTENRLELARLPIVDYNYNVVLNILVKPQITLSIQRIILFYRYSGITEDMLSNVTVTLIEAQKLVKSISDQDSIQVILQRMIKMLYRQQIINVWILVSFI
ncbi:unnamed protein product [Paramecium pentaurelia]|uniref:Uncharacterized protein n=1 Tax=Paramecium pentaurelia TaxID=43138 RepID=A0A8S1Y499_9CILI|nr:unnamed protein product [Paramecium pentaurelia]